MDGFRMIIWRHFCSFRRFIAKEKLTIINNSLF